MVDNKKIYGTNNPNAIKKMYEEAKIVRRFEIELYWRRTAYFVIFIGAIFVGYCSILGTECSKIENKNFYLTMLSILGFLVSFIWYLSNRGSKFWQENWEFNVDVLEGNGAKLYKTLLEKENVNNFDILSAYPFSVGKCNTFVSFIVSYTCLLLACFHIFKNFYCGEVSLFWGFCSSVLLFYLFYYYIVSMTRTYKKGKGIFSTLHRIFFLKFLETSHSNDRDREKYVTIKSEDGEKKIKYSTRSVEKVWIKKDEQKQKKEKK